MLDDFQKALAFHQGDAPEIRKKLEKELQEKVAAEKLEAQAAADKFKAEQLERRVPSNVVKPGDPGRNPYGVSKLKKNTTDQLIQLIKDETNDGKEIIETLLRFARGQVEGFPVKDQAQVLTYLLERLIGKTPKTIITANVTGHPALEQLTKEDLVKLALLDDEEDDAEVIEHDE